MRAWRGILFSFVRVFELEDIDVESLSVLAHLTEDDCSGFVEFRIWILHKHATARVVR